MTFLTWVDVVSKCDCYPPAGREGGHKKVCSHDMWVQHRLDYATSRAEGACYPDHLCMLRLGGVLALPCLTSTWGVPEGSLSHIGGEITNNLWHSMYGKFRVRDLILSPKLAWRAGMDDLGISWLRSRICPILLIANQHSYPTTRDISRGVGTCMVRLCDNHALGSLLRLEYMYDMQLVVSYMVRRCNDVSSLWSWHG